MNWKMLIADSGGTKTDWCLVDETGKRELFVTESYHPRACDPSFIERQKAFWKERKLPDVTVKFYGAGCYRSGPAGKMVDVLGQLGFKRVEIHSDMLAASLALNKGNGWGAICGTGSVVFRCEHGQLTEVRGGKGFREGDEGSGYYFGRLFMEQLQTVPVLRSYYEEAVAGKVDTDLTALDPESEAARIQFSNLPVLLARYKHDTAIRTLHEENIRRFAEAYLDGCQAIGLCGSYAFFQESFFRSVLGEFNIVVQGVMERPIQALTDYLVSNTAY